VDGQKGRAKAGDLGHRPLHRVGNVVQLEVEEHAFARCGEALHKTKAAAIDEFHADFIKDDAVAEPRRQPLGLRNFRHVERDDQPFARRYFQAHNVSGATRG
jgi:hypothetical protein